MMFNLIYFALSTVAIWRILLIILIIASLARHFNIPYEVGLVGAGILATFIAPESLPTISPKIYLDILLPPIVFHTALHLDVKTVISNAKFMYGYALIGTITSAILMAIISHFVIGFDILTSILLGIIISPTDPIAVVSTIEKIGASKRLAKIIEGEALFNDGAIITIFYVIVGTDIGNVNVISVLIQATTSLIIGHVMGLIVGYFTSLVARRLTKDTLVQTILSFFAMYTSYELASISGGSGIIGSAVAGIVIGNLHWNRITDEAYESMDNNWEFIDFLITSFSFVLIGSATSLFNLYLFFPLILVAFFAVLVTRVVSIFGITRILNFGTNRISSKWQVIISWAGLRGIVSIMLVLSLQSGTGSSIVDIVFGIVILSLIFQGISLSHVVPYILRNELK